MQKGNAFLKNRIVRIRVKNLGLKIFSEFKKFLDYVSTLTNFSVS